MTTTTAETGDPTALLARIQQLEDRNAISERVINYARAIDRADWTMLEAGFTDTVHIDFSEAGMPARDFARADFVAFARSGLGGFTNLQHLSPNHVIEFDAADPDRAVCYSAMYAQHRLTSSEGGEFYLMRGSYTNRMRRTSAGWQIESLTQHITWLDGNLNAPMDAFGPFQAAQAAPH